MAKIPKTDLIDEKEYHPGMKKAVRLARRKQIFLRTFPALIKVRALKRPVKWLKDISQSRKHACGGCARVGVAVNKLTSVVMRDACRGTPWNTSPSWHT